MFLSYEVTEIVLISLKTYLTLLAGDNFCHLLITFANEVDQDQDQQSVGPDLDPSRLTLY